MNRNTLRYVHWQKKKKVTKWRILRRRRCRESQATASLHQHLAKLWQNIKHQRQKKIQKLLVLRRYRISNIDGGDIRCQWESKAEGRDKVRQNRHKDRSSLRSDIAMQPTLHMPNQPPTHPIMLFVANDIDQRCHSVSVCTVFTWQYLSHIRIMVSGDLFVSHDWQNSPHVSSRYFDLHACFVFMSKSNIAEISTRYELPNCFRTVRCISCLLAYRHRPFTHTFLINHEIK